MTLLEEALKSDLCIISVMGAHAGESVDVIFNRKIADIELTGKTFWLMRSPKALPVQVQDICTSSPAYTIFVEPSSKGGARPTTNNEAAKEHSVDKKIWSQLPKGVGPVTGKIDSSATALVFDIMTTNVSGTIDLWKYSDFSAEEKPLKFILGCSTVCVIQKDMSTHPDRMKSRYRRIIAVAKLTEPYCVWLR